MLDTKNELQTAYRNLQRSDSDQQLALVTILEEHEQYFSDGSGTRSKPKMGIPESRSEHNSDVEEDDLINPKQHLLGS